MRADDAADDCCRCQNEPERRDGVNFCDITNQAGDRVHPDEKRGNGSGLPNMSPFTKQQ